MESTSFKLVLIFTVIFHQHQSSLSAPTPTFPKQALPTKSGYLTVNPTTKSAMFYAFYESQNKASPSNTPLIIWLQGGPGCFSMIGNFYELGPWRVTSSPKLEPNPGSWNRIFGLLFLDNPIGTGFSIATKPNEIPKDQQGVSEHLFIAITKFIALDPSFKSRPIYITGESYAGKYVPAIGYNILQKNLKLPIAQQVNLRGLAIGNGLTDPITQVGTQAVQSYNLGLINDKQRSEIEKLQNKVIELIKAQKWSEATNTRSELVRYLQKATGLATLFDFRRQSPYRSELVQDFLKNPEVIKALGVNASMVFEECNDAVGNALHDDVMKSAKFMVEYAVKKTKVLFYQGQCDLRDGVVSVEAWMAKMNWELDAERQVWKVEDVVAGYVQKSGYLSHAVVLGAGHFVPTDQTVNSQIMIEDWILDKGMFANKKI